MLELYKNIKNKRIELGMTQSDLALKTGYADKSMIAKIEKGQIDLQQSKIELFAKVLGSTPGDLVGWDIQSEAPRSGVVINVLGRVAAGLPIEAIENIIDTEEISEEMARTGEYFGLQIRGNSMEPRMYEGDIVIVRKQDDAESGDIVIAMVNGNDAVCKRLQKYAGGISLVSLNSSVYDPMIYSNEDIENMPVRIIGKVVELRSKF